MLLRDADGVPPLLTADWKSQVTSPFDASGRALWPQFFVVESAVVPAGTVESVMKSYTPGLRLTTWTRAEYWMGERFERLTATPVVRDGQARSARAAMSEERSGVFVVCSTSQRS